MFGLQALDIGLGLVVVYLLLSLVCTAANELIAGLLKLRAKNLAAAIDNLLKDNAMPDLQRDFYNHSLIKSLYRVDSKPSYIPPRTFALALLNLLAPANGTGAKAVANIRAQLKNLPENSSVKKSLLLLIDDAGHDIDKLRSNVETWYEDTMARASGWYKRKAQSMIVVLSIFITVMSNADTNEIAKTLSNDPEVRAALVTQARQMVEGVSKPVTTTPTKGEGRLSEGLAGNSTGAEPPEPPSIESSRKQIQESIGELERLGIPLGWQTWPKDGTAWANKIIGLMLTAFAVSLGAPFWFDMLTKVINVRAAGARPPNVGRS